MKYTVSRWKIYNMIEETGDDYSMVHVFLTFNNEAELKIPVIFTFNKLLSFIGNKAPEEYNYIQKIRDNIGGYGPKHSKMIPVMEEEGYDFYPHIKSYITEGIAESNYEYNQRIQSDPVGFAERAKEMLELFEDTSLKENKIRYIEFLESVDKALHEITLKYYPELFDTSDKVVEEYKDQLVRATTRFAEAIDKLLIRKL